MLPGASARPGGTAPDPREGGVAAGRLVSCSGCSSPAHPLKHLGQLDRYVSHPSLSEGKSRPPGPEDEGPTAPSGVRARPLGCLPAVPVGTIGPSYLLQIRWRQVCLGGLVPP